MPHGKRNVYVPHEVFDILENRFWLRDTVGIASRRLGTQRIFTSGAAVPLALALMLSSMFLVIQDSVAGSSSGWRISVLVESSSDWAMYPRIAVAASGDAMAVWTQRSPPDQFNPPGNGDVWASRYAPGVGWLPAEAFGFVPGDAPDPRVAIDSRGNAVAVWTEVEGGGARATIWSNRYVVGQGWEGVRLLADANASAPDVAIDDQGVAFVAWAVWYGGIEYQAFASRFVPGYGWEPATPLAPRGSAGPPRLAVDPSGTAIVVWDNKSDVIYANHYSPGAGWSPAVPINAPIPYGAWAPVAAASGNGSFMAAWKQQEGSPIRVWANRYDPAAGWGVAERVGTGDSMVSGRVQIAANGVGNAVAVWEQDTGTRSAVFANRFVPVPGWELETQIDRNVGPSWFPRAAVDPRGNAIVVWQQNANVTSSKFDVGAGWSDPELVETRLGSADWPDVGVDGDGNSIAVWGQFGGQSSYEIWANQYLVPDTTPPLLQVTSPADGSTTDQPTIGVSGVTERDAELIVNGVVAFVASDGSFSLDIALRPGTNLIRVTATDPAGNGATATIGVTYTDTLSDFRRDLQEARSALDALRLQVLVGLAALAVGVSIWEVALLVRRKREAEHDSESSKVQRN